MLHSFRHSAIAVPRIQTPVNVIHLNLSVLIRYQQSITIMYTVVSAHSHTQSIQACRSLLLLPTLIFLGEFSTKVRVLQQLSDGDDKKVKDIYGDSTPTAEIRQKRSRQTS